MKPIVRFYVRLIESFQPLSTLHQFRDKFWNRMSTEDREKVFIQFGISPSHHKWKYVIQALRVRSLLIPQYYKLYRGDSRQYAVISNNLKLCSKADLELASSLHKSDSRPVSEWSSRAYDPFRSISSQLSVLEGGLIQDL